MDDKRKHHKKKKVGKKAKRKKISKGANRGAKNNEAKKFHKAFAFSGGIRSAHRRKQHQFELEEKKLRVPKHFKECSKSSPLIVAIQGPKGVGKTTLLKSLIKHYVGVSINEVRGPISIITKALKRYTFVEVDDDILNMIDVAKIADLCLLVIDGSYGLELETLEFVSILNTHGLPKVIGVVTHLDKFKDSKSIRKRKKKLSKRFTEEMVEGAKIFFLSGIQNGKYNKTEIRNFCKFVSSIKRPQISWREQHGYILGLRLDVDEIATEEDAMLTVRPKGKQHRQERKQDEEEDSRIDQFLSKCDEEVCVHVEGFVYGSKIFNNQVVHIPNIGDVQIRDIQILQDPFLTDEQKKNPNVYAPMADVGNVAFDFDNMFIHIPKSKVNFTPGESLLGGGGETAAGGGGDSAEGSGEGSDEESGEESGRGTAIPPGKRDDERYMTEGIRMIRALQTSKYALCSDAEGDNEPVLFDGQEAGHRRKAPSNVFVSERQKKKKQAEKYINEKAKEYTELEPILFGKRDAEDDYHYADGVTLSASGEGEEQEQDDQEGDDEAGDDEEDDDGEDDDEEDDDEDDDDEEDDDEEDDDEDDDDEEDDDEEDDDEEDDDEDDDDEEDDEGDDVAANSANSATIPNFANYHNPGEHHLAQELAFDNKASLDAFIYDTRYIHKRNNHLYFKGDILVVMRREKKGVHGEQDFYSLLSPDAVKEEKAQRLYSYMHEENYFLDEVDSFKCTTEQVFIFNNLTVSLGDVADEALTEKFFSRYRSLYEGCFGTTDGMGSGEEVDAVSEKEANQQGDNSLGRGDTTGERDTALMDEAEGKASIKKEKAEREQQKEKYQETEGIGVLSSNTYGSSVNIGEYIKVVFKIERKKLAVMKKGIIICGGLQTYEEKESMIHCRVKKHRWFPKVLRSNDPLIISIGWRRYQSIPIYSINERNNVRIRFLKYTTEHMHCNCTFYGPLAGANNGILAICNHKKVPYYRICLNGVTLETNTNVKVMKKLKLIGEPYKIFKNTAFVKNMFNSDLEVSKFINCPVVTPSGIKGLIKSKLSDNGNCRCTFADKVRISDIVILKLYVNVKVKKFFTYDVENKLRSINELRYIYNLYVNHKSNYRSVPFRHFYHSKIHINPKLLRELPYKSKPKLFSKMSNEEELKKEKQRKDDQINFRALENPKLASRWYQMLHTIKKNIMDKKKEKAKLSYHKKLKKALMVEEAKHRVVKQRKKMSYRKGKLRPHP
ncbi:hypothetical protein C922_04903 [Plasmodium inui San Antonio 1]|uniref:Bms1-type G domain-containing protein n=1 Tax=Plasmodium inui San Antonio 1 TaxID=1237626 RepID=W7A6M7_9APIC|nr:hypothetical protein C922_04903 [Plasmodium inui San Antonio 1]EUD64759.1 hypothetical protein C922_04903 [Plasmodium inui San Antonio 1]